MDERRLGQLRDLISVCVKNESSGFEIANSQGFLKPYPTVPVNDYYKERTLLIFSFSVSMSTRTVTHPEILCTQVFPLIEQGSAL